MGTRNVQGWGRVNANLFVKSLYVTIIPKKIITPLGNTTLHAVKNL